MNKLLNRIKELEKIKNKKENEIIECEKKIKDIDVVLKEYELSVKAGRRVSLYSAILITFLLNIIEQVIFKINGINIFTLTHMMIPTILADIIPLFFGIKCATLASKKIEKEMNINVKQMKDDKLFNNSLINYNKKDIIELEYKISEDSYNLKESCINYASIEDNQLYEDKKEKVKVLKIDKNY